MGTLWKTTALLISFVCTSAAFGQHQHHAKHGMVLVGTEEVFASHIVYKVPHNYQVILRVRFAAEARAAYARMRAEFPTDQLVFVLDTMDLTQIDSVAFVTGTLARDTADARIPVLSGIRLERAEYDVLYFNELPLSLANDRH